MTIYNRLNSRNVKDFMKENFDTDMYHDVWEAVRTLSRYGFQYIKSLFDIMMDCDSELCENA